MGAAIGLAVLIIVFGVFLPTVLDALEDLFLTLLQKATLFLETLDVPGQ